MTAAENTDRTLWEKEPGFYCEERVYITRDNGIGIEVRSHCIVKSAAEWHLIAADRRLTAEQGGAEPTDAMIEAYLKANDAYWIATDKAPARDPSRWRNGTVKEATRAGLRAALTTQPQAEPPKSLAYTPSESNAYSQGWKAGFDMAQPQAEPRKPDGYAYVYPSMDGEIIRMNHGQEVNGSKPLRAMPYWFATPEVKS